MNIDRVSAHFEEEAFEYDELITRLIPKYKEQHEIILKLLSFKPEDNLSVLDLGCGTGVLSYLILKSYPSARVVAIDLAEKMLQVCAANLRSYKDRLTLRQGNFGADDLGSGYDLVISGLAIHHLDDNGKRKLYHRIFHALNPGGTFLNREIVLGATPHLSEKYHELWRQFIKSNGEDEGKWFNTYLTEDKPATVEDQLQWLKEAGFVDTGCHWRYFNYAIFGGTNPR